MTEYLFHKDPYQLECDAVVTSISGNQIELDKTVFFAFAGGQESDSGTIGEIPVVEAVKNDDTIVYTLEETPSFAVGDTVHVSVDKEKRFKLMRVHAATHVVAHFFETVHTKLPYIGSNVSTNKGRLDYGMDESVAPLLPEIQEKAQAFIDAGHAITHEEKEGEPGRYEWVCEDIRMACAGTHVRNTSEIGQIKLKRKNIGAGKERIEISLVE